MLFIYGYPRKTGVSQMISEKEQDNKCLAFVLYEKWNYDKGEYNDEEIRE